MCHDGVFSTLNLWSTEELFFPIHDFEGTMHDNRAAYEKWDPSRFTSEWATPQLVSERALLGLFVWNLWHCNRLTDTARTHARTQIIHGELDYRLPVTEGLAAFNVLQARKVPSKLVVFPDENHVSRGHR